MSNPINLNRMIGFSGKRRNVNDFTGQDQGDDGKEVNMVVHGITIRGEVVPLLDKLANILGEVIYLKQFVSKLQILNWSLTNLESCIGQ